MRNNVRGWAKKNFGSAPRGELAKQGQSLSKGVCGLAFVWPFSRVKERAKDLAFFFLGLERRQSLCFSGRGKRKRKESFPFSLLVYSSVRSREKKGKVLGSFFLIHKGRLYFCFLVMTDL